MILPRVDDFHSYQYHNLPPLYLIDAGIIGPERLSKELMLKVPVPSPRKRPEIVAEDAETVYSLTDSSEESAGRRVGFLQDTKGDIVVTRYAGLDILTPEECDAAWYKSKDFKHFRKYGKKLATIAAASKYGKDLGKTYKACARTDTQDLDRYSKIANSAARGLEVLVVPQIIKDRKGCLQSILKAQSKMPPEMSKSEREKILCATSRVLSRQSRLLAKLLGTGDANVAKAYHNEDTATLHDEPSSDSTEEEKLELNKLSNKFADEEKATLDEASNEPSKPYL